MKMIMERWKKFEMEREDIDILPGSKELGRLSRGITEEGEEAQPQTTFLLAKPEEDDELDEASPSHCKDTGRFGCAGEAGSVYSISKAGAKRAGIDPKFAYRGTYTGNKDAKGKHKTKSAFGAASGKKACGRVDIQKGDIPAKYSCSSYSKRYGVLEAVALVDQFLLELDKQELEEGQDVTVKKASRSQIAAACKRLGMLSYKDWLLKQNNAVLSAQGKLLEPRKTK